MNKADQDFVVALVVNIILAIVFLVFFLFFRNKVPKVYQPRCDGSPNSPDPPSPTLFGWVSSTINYSDEEMFQSHGLDALMFIKFVKMMLIICAIVSLYGFVVLFPVNATGENTKCSTPSNCTSNPLYVTGLNALTMSAIKEHSNRMVAQLFSVVINSLVVYYFTFNLYKEYMKYRLRYKANTMCLQNYTVLIRSVPKSLSDENLRSFFDTLYPGKVEHLYRSYCTPKLDDKLVERDNSKKAVEKAYAVHLISGARPTNKDKLLVGQVVDSIDWHTENFNKFTTEAKEMQTNKHPLACVILVVFNDLSAATQCSTAVLDSRNRLIPEPAPEPKDLVWSNFNIDRYSFKIRKLATDIFFFFLIFFWVIPVTFVSGISNLESLQKLEPFHFLKYFTELSPVVTGFVQGFLPTLAFIIFFALLVKIIYAVVTLTGLFSKSQISRGVMTKYYLFLVFNVLLVYTIAGSIFNVLQDILDDPSSIVSLLANSLPQQSTFFINYVMLLSFGGHTKALWRPGPLIVRWIFHKFLSKTAREWREAENPGSFAYAESYATHLLVFTILLVYSTLAPFIMIFGVIYFCLAYISSKYNIVYVHVPEWEGGGQHWQEVFNRIYATVILYQVVLLGVFGIFKFVPGAVISGIFIGFTVLVWWFTTREFRQTCEHLPLRITLNRSDFYTPLDNNGKAKEDYSATSLTEFKNLKNKDEKDTYLQPSLQPIVDEPELVLAPGKAPGSSSTNVDAAHIDEIEV